MQFTFLLALAASAIATSVYGEGEDEKDTVTPAAPKPVIGGSTTFKDVTRTEVLLWRTALSKHVRTPDVTIRLQDLNLLGDPIKYKTQAVAGTKYWFVFATDDVVTVFEQSWTDTLKIEEWTDQTSVEALLQARADEKAAAAVLAAAARANATGVPVTNTATDDTAPCEDKDPKKCPQYQQEIGCGTAFERIDSGTGATISIDVNEECKLTCNMCNNNAERQGQDGEGLVLDDAQTATLQACLSLCELASADAEALAECNGVCDATATTTASSSQSNGGGLSAVASGLVVGLALILV